jgi:hypothetical protein
VRVWFFSLLSVIEQYSATGCYNIILWTPYNNTICKCNLGLQSNGIPDRYVTTTFHWTGCAAASWHRWPLTGLSIQRTCSSVFREFCRNWHLPGSTAPKLPMYVLPQRWWRMHRRGRPDVNMREGRITSVPTYIRTFLFVTSQYESH